MKAFDAHLAARLLWLLLLALLCAPLATAQHQKGATPQPQAQETAPTAQTPAQAAPEQQATPETVTPAQNAQPMKEGDRLTFMAENSSETSAEAPSAGGLLVRTLGALLLIVGLIVAVGWGMRRFGGARFGGAARVDGPELTVLTSVALGDRRSLAVVRFGERNLLIGSTAQSLTLLAADDLASGETQTPVLRSVADLLKTNETKGFDEELTDAAEQIEQQQLDWRKDGAAG